MTFLTIAAGFFFGGKIRFEVGQLLNRRRLSYCFLSRRFHLFDFILLIEVVRDLRRTEKTFI